MVCSLKCLHLVSWNRSHGGFSLLNYFILLYLLGWGLYTWPDRKYVGEWQDNLMHGFGIFTWADDRKYTGQYIQVRPFSEAAILRSSRTAVSCCRLQKFFDFLTQIFAKFAKLCRAKKMDLGYSNGLMGGGTRVGGKTTSIRVMANFDLLKVKCATVRGLMQQTSLRQPHFILARWIRVITLLPHVIISAEYNAGTRLRWLEGPEIEEYKKEHGCTEEPDFPQVPQWLSDLSAGAKTEVTETPADAAADSADPGGAEEKTDE